MKMMPTLIPLVWGAAVVVDMALACRKNNLDSPKKDGRWAKDGVLVGWESKQEILKSQIYVRKEGVDVLLTIKYFDLRSELLHYKTLCVNPNTQGPVHIYPYLVPPAGQKNNYKNRLHFWAEILSIFKYVHKNNDEKNGLMPSFSYFSQDKYSWYHTVKGLTKKASEPGLD